MSDIRLKNITIENGTLNFQNGNISITNTTSSTNAITGALVVNGGISVSGTADSVSSTSGGGLTVAGGLAVTKQTFLGNNLTIDNNNATISIAGASVNRLFLDSTTNKQFYISVDGVNKQLNVNTNVIFFTTTTVSTNSSTGALVILGGVSLNSTSNSSSVSSGGAITIAGGAGIAKDVYIGQNLSVLQTINAVNINISTGNITSTITGNLDVSNTGVVNIFSSSGNINLSSSSNSLQITQTNSTFNKNVVISSSTSSSNSSSGALVISGGVGIIGTVDSSSSTNGGALTIAGGLAIAKKMVSGDLIAVELANGNKFNKILLYQSTGNLTETSVMTGLGVVSSGSMSFQVPSSSSDYIFYSGSTTNQVFRIKGNNQIVMTGNSQPYSFIGGGISTSDFTLQGQSSGSSSLNLMSFSGNSNVNLKIVGLGTPGSVVNTEYLSLGWNSTSSNYLISTNFSGTGVSRPIVFNNQLTLNTDGTVIISNTSSSGLTLQGAGLVITNTGSAFSASGNAIISKNLTVNGAINIFSSSGNITFSAQNSSGDTLITNPSTNFTFTGTNTNGNSSLNLTSITSTTGNFQQFQIQSSNGSFNILSKASGSPIQSININSQLFLATNGNVSINTSNSSYNLDINGGLRSNNYSQINQLTIYNTSDSTTTGSSGSLTVLGGASISKSLLIGGIINCSNTNASLFSGPLNIINATASTFGSGALSVTGGASISGELYVNQNAFIQGTLNVSSIGTLSKVSIISTASNSISTLGGITINSSVNSTNTSVGGSLLALGGASIQKDLYLGGNLTSFGIINLNHLTASSLLNLYDTSSVVRFSIDRNVSTNNFSVSRYNSIGTLVEKSIDISNATGIITLNNTSSNSFILTGGIAINCTVDATALNGTSSLTVLGGASISKKLFVGGNTSFSSTTDSIDYITGAVVVSGGVGIGGNVNILGNTIIGGNLTIIGTTTSVQSSNTLLTDNIIILNSGPAGTHDSGFMIQRYQTVNDSGSGDVVNDPASLTDTLPNQGGMTSTQIKFSTNLSSVNDAYTGYWIKITSGFSVNQTRKITGYVGSTRIATIDTPFTTQNPAGGDSLSFYNKPYTGLIFNETLDRFEFGSTIQDPGASNVEFTDNLPIYFKSCTAASTVPSTASNIGSIISVGGIGISCTSDSVSVTSGGGLTIAGGASVGKTLNVNKLITAGVSMTPNSEDILSSVSFTAANNVITASNITGLAFSTSWGADIYISCQLTATTNAYANYTLKIVNQNGTWDIISTYVGSNIVTFSINSSGQIQYTCSNFPGFVSLIFRFKAITN